MPFTEIQNQLLLRAPSFSPWTVGHCSGFLKNRFFVPPQLIAAPRMPWTSAQVVNAVIAKMGWPDHMNQKFRSIPCPPCGARLANWDLQDALDWMDSDLGDEVQTRRAAECMVGELRLDVFPDACAAVGVGGPGGDPPVSVSVPSSVPDSGAVSAGPFPRIIPPLFDVEFHDRFLSKRMRCRILSPQSAQVDAPLHVIEAAAARLHLPRGYAVEHEQARSPSAYMHVSLWPAQLQRVAVGFTCAASHALATAPASVRVDAWTTRRWATRILVRVMGGLVGKIQVGTACRALCLCRVLFYARCRKLLRIASFCAPCTLTWSAGCMPPSALYSRQRHAARPSLFCRLPLVILQDAAVARIAGERDIFTYSLNIPDIHEAAENGDVGRVRDLVVEDPACVHEEAVVVEWIGCNARPLHFLL